MHSVLRTPSSSCESSGGPKYNIPEDGVNTRSRRRRCLQTRRYGIILVLPSALLDTSAQKEEPVTARAFLISTSSEPGLAYDSGLACSSRPTGLILLARSDPTRGLCAFRVSPYRRSFHWPGLWTGTSVQIPPKSSVLGFAPYSILVIVLED